MANFADIHTHFFPPLKMPAGLWCGQQNEPYWGSLLSPQNRKTLQDFTERETFLAAMDNACIKRSVLNGAYWQNTKTCMYANDTALDFAKAYPDRISAFAAINPADFEGSKKILQSARSRGFCGVGELCDAVQNFSYKSPEFLKLMQICDAEKLPVCLHLGDPFGKMYSGKIFTDNNAAFGLADKFENVNFIFAHLAGGEILRRKFAKKNAFFDTAAFPLLYGKERWQTAFENSGGNLLFGSDYSLRLYPKTQKTADIKTLKDEAAQNLPESFLPDFFENNARKVLGFAV